LKTVGLVLGSGGARGLAHIGVIRALEAANIPVQCIAGASIGALVGAIYAAQELDEFEEFVCALDWRAIVSYFDVVFPSMGLLDGDRIYELLSDHLKTTAIEEVEIQFCCVATDLASGQEVRLQSGPMVDAVRASISIPGVFTPFQKDGQYLGDGGVVNPVPVDVMRDMGADIVIAVNLNSSGAAEISEAASPSAMSNVASSSEQAASSGETSDRESSPTESASTAETDTPSHRHRPRKNLQSRVQDRIQSLLSQVQQRYEAMQDQVQEKMQTWMPEQKQGMNIFDVIGASLAVMEQQVTMSKLAACPPDLLLEPSLKQYGIFDFHQADAIIDEGYRCMNEVIPEIQRQLAEMD